MRSGAVRRQARGRTMVRLAIGASILVPALILGAAAEAQGFMRSPSLNIAPRVPAVSVDHGPRINPNLGNIGAARVPRPVLTARHATLPVLPYAHYSPNLYPACTSPFRDSDGECLDSAVSSSGGGSTSGKKHVTDARPNRQQAAVPARSIANEIVAEIDGTLSDAQADALARRHRLARIASQNFPLIGATIGLFRITDRRSVETASRDFASDASVHA